MQSSSQMITANKPTSSFLQAGCPSRRPANSVRATKNHIHELWASTGRLPASCEVSWLPWGRLPSLSSALRHQYPNNASLCNIAPSECLTTAISCLFCPRFWLCWQVIVRVVSLTDATEQNGNNAYTYKVHNLLQCFQISLNWFGRNSKFLLTQQDCSSRLRLTDQGGWVGGWVSE